MKNTRKMGIASLLLISLFLIQLIPSLGVKVKAAEKNVTVTVKFEGYTDPDKTVPIGMTINPDDIPTEEELKQDIQNKLQQEKEKLAKENYYVHAFKLEEGEYKRLTEDLNTTTLTKIEPITATATLKTFEDLKVTIKFEGVTPEEKSITFKMQGNQVTKATEQDFWNDIKKVNSKDYQDKLKEIEKKNYSITSFTLEPDEKINLQAYVDDKTTKNSEVTAKATFTQNAPLTVFIKFQYPEPKAPAVTISFDLAGNEVTTQDQFIGSLKTNQTYLREERGKTDNKYFVSSLKLDDGQDTKLANYIKNKTQENKVMMTAILTPLKPLKTIINVSVDDTPKTPFELLIPAEEITTEKFKSETEIKALVLAHSEIKNKTKNLTGDIDKDYKWQYQENALNIVNKYLEDSKIKDAGITIYLSYPKANPQNPTNTTNTTNTTNSTNPTNPTNPSVKRHDYGYQVAKHGTGALLLQSTKKGPDVPGIIDLSINTEPLRRGFASREKVPVPQGDRMLAQYFTAEAKDGDDKTINLSKYTSTLTLKIDENASSSAITVYQRVPGSNSWNRISRSQYSYYRSSGELKIEDLDDLGEFVVWINKDAKEPQPLDPRPLQRLPLNPSVQVKPNGMLPQGVAPFPQANPQVPGSLMPQASQVPQANPNAYLPVTGEKNYIGIMMGTLILACGALILRKSMK